MHKILVSPAFELTLLRDVIIDYPTAIIVNSKGQLEVEQCDEALHWLPDALGRASLRGSTLDNEFKTRLFFLQSIATRLHTFREHIPRLAPDINYIYMLHPFGFYAFGHFFDSIQRLRFCIDSVPEPWRILHCNPNRIVEFEEHLRLLGIERDRLVRVDGHIAVPNLWISPWQAPPAQITPDAYAWIYPRYTRNIDCQKRRRLYLSRNHVRPGQRSVVNEDAVRQVLEPYGFKFVSGSEKLADIVELFHCAEIIIGGHGSLFANSMFCQGDCDIIEFCPRNRVDLSFRNKFKLAKSYRHIVVEGDASFNIEIPLDQLKNILEDAAIKRGW